ncbi:MAG TPA: polymer-forming cytoskeletal protein [Bacteroidetes bacterium]|nr:polymer-forming cytoskeletal protein [Bacteroidota bacterium]
MLGTKEKRTMAHDNVLNTIARGTILEGKITTKGDIRVEGRVIGTITCDAKLVIGEHGSVEGYVDARNAYIAGSVKGEVVVRELLQLQEKGRIEGDILTQKLSVQVGATFTGNCRMGQEAKKVMGQTGDDPNTNSRSGKRNIFSPNGKRATGNTGGSVLGGQQEAS